MFLSTLILKVIISITGFPVDSNVFNTASGFQIGDGHSTHHTSTHWPVVCLPKIQAASSWGCNEKISDLFLKGSANMVYMLIFSYVYISMLYSVCVYTCILVHTVIMSYVCVYSFIYIYILYIYIHSMVHCQKLQANPPEKYPTSTGRSRFWQQTHLVTAGSCF